MGYKLCILADWRTWRVVKFEAQRVKLKDPTGRVRGDCGNNAYGTPSPEVVLSVPLTKIRPYGGRSVVVEDSRKPFPFDGTRGITRGPRSDHCWGARCYGGGGPPLRTFGL